jgi:hypothetical protein
MFLLPTYRLNFLRLADEINTFKMGAKQSSHNGNMKDALKFFEDEVEKWNDNIKNLKESWDTKDRSWVPEYLEQQMDETETRWTNIRTLIVRSYLQSFFTICNSN